VIIIGDKILLSYCLFSLNSLTI